MKRAFLTKLCVGVFITLIACQPIILIMGLQDVTIRTPARRVALAQEPGSRLQPGEYTNHVPFSISQTSDFTAQGYPGSGTSGDPYVIAGLNISAGVGVHCIEIKNTTAYFVIRDCYIKQESSSMMDTLAGISLLNTTHGTIEYCTIISADRGISLNNANNTLVTHTESHAVLNMGLYGQDLYQTTYTWNLFNSTEHRAMRIDDGDYCTVTDSKFHNTDVGGWYCTAFFSVNHTTINNCEMYCDGGFSGIAINSAFYSSISNTLLWAPDANQGVNVDACPNITLTGLTISGAYAGADIDASPGFVLTDSSITDIQGIGLDMVSSGNSSVSNVDVSNTESYGMYIFSSGMTNISDCEIDTTASTGLLCGSSSDVRIDSVSVTNTADQGIFLGDSHRALISECTVGPMIASTAIYVDTSHNGTLVNSAIQTADGDGIYTDSSENWTVSGNTFSMIEDISIYLYNGVNMIVSGNTMFDLVDDNGIFVNVCPDSVVSFNTVSDTTDTGIYVSQSERSLIEGNMVSDSDFGISCDTSDNTTIISNTIQNIDETGLAIYNFDHPNVTDNIITDARIGIHTDLHYNVTLDGNIMTNCGFLFGGNYPIQYYEYDMTGNTVNSLPVYFGIHEDTESLDGTVYGQFILVNCSNFDINGGVFSSVSCPVELLHCDYVTVDGLTSVNNVYAVYIYNSDNVTLSNVDSTGRGFSDSSFGVFAANSDDFILEESSFMETYWMGRGILNFRLCVDVDISKCYVSDGYHGMYFDDTANVTILDCDVMHNTYSGINFWDDPCMFIHIERNNIYNSTRGIYGDQASEWIVRNNTVRHNTLYGMYFGSGVGDNANISLNTLENNRDGIYVSSPDFYYIYNNTIRWNTRYGVYLSGSSFTEVFYNIIALSGTDNGVDDRDFNFWDDGSVLGNWWDDWGGTGSYAIDTFTIDRWPQLYLPTEPVIDQPMDISYAEFSTGNTITWNPFDDALRDWELVIDGEAFATGIWDFVDITVNVDGLDYGTHTAVLTVWDVGQNTVTDTVLIHVFDDTPPTISSESDRVAFEDATGQVAEWTANDLHPSTYSFLIDEVVVSTGAWTSGTVQGGLDGLSVGDHTVQMTVFDLDGNSASNEIIVRVVDDDTPPLIDSPPDFNYTEGFTQNFIVWSPFDEYPDSYSVMYNGSVFTSGDWTGSIIAVNVDGLATGNHTFTITVYDGAGLSTTDSVEVVVIPPEGVTTPPPPADLTMLLIIAGVGAAVVVVIVIIYFLKQRGGYKP